MNIKLAQNQKLAQVQFIDPSAEEEQAQTESLQTPTGQVPTGSSNALPQTNKGNRVILDQEVQAVPKLEESKSVPVSTYYWLGAVVLLILAFVTAYSMYYKSKVVPK